MAAEEQIAAGIMTPLLVGSGPAQGKKFKHFITSPGGAISHYGQVRQ